MLMNDTLKAAAGKEAEVFKNGESLGKGTLSGFCRNAHRPFFVNCLDYSIGFCVADVGTLEIFRNEVGAEPALSIYLFADKLEE